MTPLLQQRLLYFSIGLNVALAVALLYKCSIDMPPVGPPDPARHAPMIRAKGQEILGRVIVDSARRAQADAILEQTLQSIVALFPSARDTRRDQMIAILTQPDNVAAHLKLKVVAESKRLQLEDTLSSAVLAISHLLTPAERQALQTELDAIMH